jgi:hypothetical protein
MKRNGHAGTIAAHHEAGHAVIAHMLGGDVGRVSIDDDGGGATSIKWLGRGDDEQRIQRKILVALAGPYSQRRFAPRSRWRSRSHVAFASGYDFNIVDRLIEEFASRRLIEEFVSRKVAEKYQGYVEARAEALVDKHWRCIKCVAEALLERGAITGDIRTVFPPVGADKRA